MLDRAQIVRIQNANGRRAVVILGARKSGKKSLLERVIQDTDCVWIRAENPEEVKKLVSAFKNNELGSLLVASNLVIDQAQNVPDFAQVIRALVDKNEATRIVALGSSLIDLETFAPGRFDLYQMWPLSVTELAKEIGWTSLEKELNSRIVFGMYPQAVLSSQPQKFLEDYCTSTMLRDIFSSGAVRNPIKLFSLLNALAERIGSEINYDSLCRELALSKITLLGYLDLLEQNFIIKRCESYANNLPGELKKGKKIYFCDTGVRNAILRDFSPLSSRRDAQALWENFFFMEQVKKNSNEGSAVEICFWRTRETGGVKPRSLDFVGVKDNRPMWAYDCSLTAKPKGKSGKVFTEAYPDCPVRIATPGDIREVFSSWQRISFE